MTMSSVRFPYVAKASAHQETTGANNYIYFPSFASFVSSLFLYTVYVIYFDLHPKDFLVCSGPDLTCVRHDCTSSPRTNIGQVTIDPHISALSDKITMDRCVSSLSPFLLMDRHETSFSFLGETLG